MTEEEKDKQQAEAKAEVEAKAETKTETETETEAEESTETKPKSKPKAKAPAKAKASAQGKEEAGEGGGGDGDGRFADLLERIDAMTVRELVDFVAAIEERYNVSAAAAVAPVAAPAAAAGDGAAEAAPSTLQVVLKSAGQQKVQVIKKVKEITGKGLKESKELVDGAPSVIKDGVDPDEANRLKAQLEEVGAEVELK